MLRPLIDKHFCHQMPLYEGLYQLLTTLLPDLRALPAGEILQTEKTWQAELTMLSQDRYTSIIALDLTFANRHLPDLRMRLRAYHDAKVAEVTEYQGHGHWLPQYRYPNPAGFQADEKRQVNQLLLEWLIHFRQRGSALRLVDCC